VAATPPTPPTPTAGDTACEIAAGPPTRHDSLSIALTEPVDPAHAPAPRTDAERLVFRQLYETLIRADCHGRIAPGLAETWTRDETGRRWTFTLRPDARFWDGAPVTARDVLASWVSHDSSWADAARTAGERVLHVLLPRAADSVPRLFADPALAVSKPAPDRAWPIGTGRFWVSATTSSAQEIRATPTPDQHDLPVAVFRVFLPGAARDALDAAVDLLVTGDPAVIDYAATRAEYAALPLPWDRTYVLVTAPGGGDGASSITSADLDDLRRAVHVDARAADRFFWWWGLTGCELAPARDPGPARPGRAPGRLLYERLDRTAQDLADRLVARSLVGRGTVAAGLAPDAFATALAAGGDAASLVVFHRLAAARCSDAEQVPALARAGASLVPLVDTRLHAVLRRGLPQLALDWDGTVRLGPP
jgi:hypothetical protein